MTFMTNWVVGMYCKLGVFQETSNADILTSKRIYKNQYYIKYMKKDDLEKAYSIYFL